MNLMQGRRLVGLGLGAVWVALAAGCAPVPATTAAEQCEPGVEDLSQIDKAVPPVAC